MNIRRSAVLIVLASILLTAVPGALLIYHYAMRHLVAQQMRDLENLTDLQALLVAQQWNHGTALPTDPAQATSALSALLSATPGQPGTQHVVLDAQGQILLTGPWRAASEPGSSPDPDKEASLQALQRAALTARARSLESEVSAHGQHYLAVGVTLQPQGWRYFRLTPMAALGSPYRTVLIHIGVFILVLTTLSGLAIAYGLGSSVSRRLQSLRGAAQGYASEYPRATSMIAADDEITQVMTIYHDMARDIDRNVAQRLEVEAALRRSEELWRFALEGAGDGVWDWNLLEDTVDVTPRGKEMLGYKLGDISNLREDWKALVHPEDRASTAAALRSHLRGETAIYVNEHRLRCKDGNYIWILDRGMVVTRRADGKPLRVIGTHSDITTRKLAERKLELAASVFSHAREAIMITDVDGIIIDVNEAFTRITGYAREEALGQSPRMLNSGRQTADFYTAMWNDLTTKGHWYGEVWNRRKNGELFAEMQTVSTVRDAQGNVQHFVALFSDITALKEHQHELEHIAHFDALTKLPNRVLLADRLHQAMVQAQRRQHRLAVAYLDLDGFKAVNDSHGHQAGDHLLVVLATRMKQALREGDTLARLGGDEFVAVLLDLPDMETSVPLLERVLAAAAEPVSFGSARLQVSASLGVTFYPQAGDVDADLLLRQADQSMYRAKLSGKNRYCVFNPEADGLPVPSVRAQPSDDARREVVHRDNKQQTQPEQPAIG